MNHLLLVASASAVWATVIGIAMSELASGPRGCVAPAAWTDERAAQRKIGGLKLILLGGIRGLECRLRSVEGYVVDEWNKGRTCFGNLSKSVNPADIDLVMKHPIKAGVTYPQAMSREIFANCA